MKGAIPVENEDDLYFEFDSTDVFDSTTMQLDKTPLPRYDLAEYFYNNLTFPAQAQKDEIEGKVMVRFLVNKDGSITNVIVTKGLELSVDLEALRVITMMPKWDPAKVDGRKTKLWCIMAMKYPWSYLYEKHIPGIKVNHNAPGLGLPFMGGSHCP
jgi:TonB family protein